MAMSRNLVEVLLVLGGAALALAAPQQGTYVWDLLPTPLNAAQVTELFAAAVPGETFPIYSEPPKTSFTCQGKLGYYADPHGGCQVFQRCTLGGDQISYLCPNGTLFNQLVLVCDWWFNVDCSKAESYYNFANPRIYDQHAKLHDTPPREYVAPWQHQQLVQFQRQIDAQALTQQQGNVQVLIQPNIAAPATAIFPQQQPPQHQAFVASSPVQPPAAIYTQAQQPAGNIFATQPAAVQQAQTSQSESAVDAALRALRQKLENNIQNQQQPAPLDVTFVPETSQQQKPFSFLSPDGGAPHLSISPLALKPFSVQRAY